MDNRVSDNGASAGPIVDFVPAYWTLKELNVFATQENVASLTVANEYLSIIVY